MDADELYGLPLEQFIPERTALAKELRAAGERDEAAAVAALRKPTVAAWAVNQLVRSQRKAVAALLAAGDELRKAQDELLAGRGDARALRSANERERTARERVVETARGLLTAEGEELSAAVLERVDETLHAAALDDAAREQVRGGRLERELRHAGLGFGEGVLAAGPPKAKPRKPAAEPRATAKPKQAAPKSKRSGKGAAKREQAAADRAAERERVAAERAEQQRLDEERAAAKKAARSAETAARRRAERAARALKSAEQRHARAEQAFDEAQAELADAREEAEEALAEHERAKQALADAR